MVDSGTLNEKLARSGRAADWLVEIVQSFAVENSSATTMVFITRYSIPAVVGSSTLRIALWMPVLVGLIVMLSVTGRFFRFTLAGMPPNVPSFPVHERLYVLLWPPLVRVSVSCRMPVSPGVQPSRS